MTDVALRLTPLGELLRLHRQARQLPGDDANEKQAAWEARCRIDRVLGTVFSQLVAVAGAARATVHAAEQVPLTRDHRRLSSQLRLQQELVSALDAVLAEAFR